MRFFFFHITLSFVCNICLSMKAHSLTELELYFSGAYQCHDELQALAWWKVCIMTFRWSVFLSELNSRTGTRSSLPYLVSDCTRYPSHSRSQYWGGEIVLFLSPHSHRPPCFYLSWHGIHDHHQQGVAEAWSWRRRRLPRRRFYTPLDTITYHSLRLQSNKLLLILLTLRRSNRNHK